MNRATMIGGVALLLLGSCVGPERVSQQPPFYVAESGRSSDAVAECIFAELNARMRGLPIRRFRQGNAIRIIETFDEGGRVVLFDLLIVPQGQGAKIEARTQRSLGGDSADTSFFRPLIAGCAA
jgi:hypothetical protein